MANRNICCEEGCYSPFIALVLLVTVCLSVPAVDSICFLTVHTDKAESNISFKFGVFGYKGNGTASHLGYRIPITSGELASSTIHNLTYTLIFHLFAALVSALPVLFGCRIRSYRASAGLLTLWSSLTALLALVAFVLDMVLFTIVQSEFLELGWEADYGIAMWLTLFAALSAACDAFRSHTGRPANMLDIPSCCNALIGSVQP